MFLNNIAQLVSALGGGGSPAVYVSVFSVSSCVGRLLLGCPSSCSNLAIRESCRLRTGTRSSPDERLCCLCTLATGIDAASVRALRSW